MITITFLGHSSFQMEVGGKHLIFDPFISPNEKAAAIDVDSLAADYILLSHGHQDHVADVERIGKRTQATLVANFEIASYYGGKGIENYHPLNHGGSKVFDFGRVKYVNAIHSSVLPDGTYGGNPGGFVIEHEKGAFYYAGDTALTYDMKLIAEEFTIDFALLPIGDNFTMGIDDALKAADFVGTDKIIAMHFDTFPYIEIDLEEAKRKAAAAKKELIVLEIGQSITL
ncbi:metal-dependent hydrolase [Nitritalea halalkaliphila LW7]|uniref:UPF0173 metal-dependent hydrolase A3SI_18442 n=1 Tax=Nitritalea halalkaliphila LW7 TaxID=1189621 RepID=I5BU32_9BACT|nr:metal-dependent hydrolase [Nitritalea halalkaliphila]EIM73084.1 metal-dependent hydrolase [Nitritalea halalkaliphila LW7]